MRTSLAGLLVGAGLVTTLLPAAPAAADCIVLVYVVTGECTNVCRIVASTYRTVDATAFDLLPDRDFVCLA